MQASSAHLIALLGAEKAAEFLENAWPGGVFHTVTNPEAWPSFLRSPLWTNLPALEQRYRGSIDVSRGDGQYSVSGLSLAGAVRDLGLVVRLAQIESVFPEVTQWLAECEHELGMPPGFSRISAFLNPPHLGLGPHCDPGDHLMFHLVGEKKVRVLANPSGAFVSASHATSYPLRREDAAQFSAGLPSWKTLPDEAQEFNLVPGSVLFIPRGTYHETEAGPNGISVSFVIGMNSPSRAEVFVKTLREFLIQDEAWRTPALRGSTSPGTWRELLTQLQPLLPELEPGRHAQPTEALGLSDRIVRDPAVQVHFEPKEGNVAVHFQSERSALGSVQLGEAAARVVAHLASAHEPRAISDLLQTFGEWDPQSVNALVQLMRRKGALLALQPALFT